MQSLYSENELDMFTNSLEKLSEDGKQLCSCGFAMLQPEREKVTLPFVESDFPLQGPLLVMVSCNNCLKTHLFSYKMLTS